MTSVPREVGSDPVTASDRRRQLGTGSARSILLTILGEFVHPDRRPVWTGTLVEALAVLGVEEKAARQALTRTAAEGLLESTRHGRRVLWHLTDSGHDLLEEGTERIYGFMRAQRPWDGRWLVLTVAIPETQRQLRHRLRTRLTWLGLGTPTPGLWVTPDATKSDAVRAVIRELGLEGQSFAWVGPAGGIGEETRLLADAWDLAEVEERYLVFIDLFEKQQSRGPRSAFRAQVELVQDWRQFPFLDPDLPAELLDHDWPGPRAAAAFHDRHARWARDARAAWQDFERVGGPLP
jgi:phenylacetic acid degradation operon negative regulatory protein